MQPILIKLTGGDRRSIGRSNEVVAEVFSDPGLFDAVFSGLLSNSPLLRMRAADAIEKITIRHPEYLQPYKTQLLEHVALIDQKEVRWHVAQMVSRVEWSPRERQRVVSVLMEYLCDASSIVKTCAMQALADLARQAPELRANVLVILQDLTAHGTPAMKARGRRLLVEMEMPVTPSTRMRRTRRAA